MNNYNQLPFINPFLNNINTTFNPNLNQNIFLNQMNQMPNQMMMMNYRMLMGFNNQNIINEYDDVYYYIKEDKKKIVFIRVLDNESFKVLVPNSLRKNELYITAEKYKKYKYSDMQLYHKERFMNADETTIDCVGDGDEIKIIEEIHGVDFSYYDLYLLKHQNEPKINVIFIVDSGLKKMLNLTLNTTVEEMIKMISFELNIPTKFSCNFFFISDREILRIDDKSTLKEKYIRDLQTINILKKDNVFNHRYNGKPLKVLVKDKNNNLILETFAGTLETISKFYIYLINNYKHLNITKIKINEKEFQKKDERTFSSIGIRDDFTVNIE